MAGKRKPKAKTTREDGSHKPRWKCKLAFHPHEVVLLQRAAKLAKQTVPAWIREIAIEHARSKEVPKTT